MPKAFSKAGTSGEGSVPPMIVMLSSAGVTRTGWDEAKKERLVGAADIPIIRLNPMGILEKKKEAEQILREWLASIPIASRDAAHGIHLCRREWRALLHREADGAQV